MHWGLTTFERKRIERIALDHPFFDMHPQLLTRKELRAVLAQGPRKSGPQVIAEVRKELGMIYAPDCQNQRTFAEALRDATFVPSFRRMVAVIALCLLMIFFMVFTVPGRAFAEEVYSLFVSFTSGSLKAGNLHPSSSQRKWDFLSIPNDLDSPQVLADVLSYPIVVTNDELVSFRCIPIDINSLVIRSKYKGENGKAYVLEQRIYNDETLWGYEADNYENAIQVHSSIDVMLYGGTSPDGTNILAGFTEQSAIQLSSKQLSLSELVLIARRLDHVPME